MNKVDDLFVEKVSQELKRYSHPLFQFSCSGTGGGVELTIGMKIKGLYDHVYSILLTDRDINAPQFPWSFQRLLFNCLHDYVVEMFEKTPQSRS